MRRLTAAFVSAILCLCVCCTIFSPTNTCAQSEKEFGENAYDFLKAVGAVEEEVYNAEELIERNRFIKMVLYLSRDAQNVPEKFSGIFSDVTPLVEHANYIEAAYEMGYISGSRGGNFEPQSVTTLPQAVKILLTVLGYADIAEAEGGYPYGYITTAEKYGLTEKISYTLSMQVDMSTAMKLFYNAVNMDIMQLMSDGNTTKWEVYEDRTILTERYNIYCEEGIMNATGYTDLLSSQSEVPKGYIQINDKVLAVGKSMAEDFLGYHIKCYYEDFGNIKDPEVVYVEVTNKNSALICEPENLELGSGLTYIHNDGDRQKIELSQNATYILNGRMAAISEEDIIDIDKGEVVFISNNSDDEFDVVMITSYSTYVITGVSKTSYTLKASDGTKIVLDPDDTSYTFTITQGDETAEFDDIAVDSVILMAESTGAGLNKKEILLSNNSVKGIITAKDDEHITISNAQYKLDKNLDIKIKVGSEADCLVDAMGYVVYVKGKSDIVYGYLYILSQQPSEEVYCKIFTENDRWVELTFCKKLKVDGTLYTDQKAYKYIAEASGNYRQLIRYKVNSDAEITMIELAKSIPIGDAEEDTAISEDKFRLSYSGALTWRDSPRSFEGKFFADSATKVFIIPKDYAEDKFKICSVSDLSSDTSYSLKAYNVDEYLYTGVLQVEDFERKVSSASKMMIVKSVGGMIINSDDEPAYALTGYWNGGKISFPVAIGTDAVSQEDYNALNTGDIIHFTYDDRGNVNKIIKYNIDENGYFLSSSGVYNIFNVIGGQVVKSDASTGHIKIAYNSKECCGIVAGSSAKIYIYDTEKEEYSMASVKEILEGDRIVANMRYLICRELIVIR